ncbi:MAG: hypothetical protein IKM25_07490 [Clostridia bacterium]|nr:hypothetical protein [Clostridia bacterium]
MIGFGGQKTAESIVISEVKNATIFVIIIFIKKPHFLSDLSEIYHGFKKIGLIASGISAGVAVNTSVNAN